MGFLLVALQDDPADVRKFMEEGGFDLPILLDSSGNLADHYRVSAVPTVVLVDAETRIANVKVGFSTTGDLKALVDGVR